MKRIIENIKFMQDGTMVFGDLHLEDGFVERIDYKTPHMVSDIAIPGFVDVHTHGFHGCACDDIRPENLRQLALEYPKRGITSFCPTISARSLAEYVPIIEAYRDVFSLEYRGARYEGLHLEGPYLHEDRKGAMERVEPIHLAQLEEFLAKYHKDIKIMTIAPDVEHAMEAMQLLHLYGVEISLGHTNANYEQTVEAFEQGATQITHLCNTMPEITHRHPTMLDAIFQSDCLCEIIMDGIHVQREMLKWLLPLLGSHRVIAISEGTKYSGFHYPDGYVLEDGCIVQQGAVYRENQLCGSCLDMLDIFQYLYQVENRDLHDCIRMCSTNAAHMLKSYSYEISLGKPVNLVILGHDLGIKEVIVQGRSVL